MKSERPRLALVKNSATLRDEVQPVGPARVSSFHLVVEAIQQSREMNPQLAHARVGHTRALGFIPRTAEQHAVFHVRLHLPNVGGMRLENVNRVEIDLALVLLGQLVEGGNLPPKWRSSVAAENQHDRPLGPKRSEIHGRGVREMLHRQRRGSIANLEMAFARPHP